MNKKMMALAVAGAFAAPAAAFAQASNVQIYGTAYIEYAYAKQGNNSKGQLNNTDLLQTPGSAIGFKGEEALGGGLTAWFQCESTAEFRGAGTQNGVTATTGQGTAAQNSGIFCGRNSAVGIKGNFGNIFAGNWDTPMKAYNTSIMGTNETGFLGTSFVLYGTSTSLNDASNPTVFERRQNNSISYISPTWSGFSARALVSTPQTTIGVSSNATLGKPRVWGLGVNYTNGPLILLASYEQHANFGTLNGNSSQKGTTDTGYQLGAAYQFGPVKAGAIYVRRNLDGGCNTLVAPVAAAGAFALNTTTGAVTQATAANVGCTGDAQVSSYGINLDWAIVGPHELKAAWVHANSTSGSNAAGVVGNMVFNGGIGNTGGSLWELEYIYNLSKRTRLSVGYAQQNNDSSAVYTLGGFATAGAGVTQSAWGTSLKTTF